MCNMDFSPLHLNRLLDAEETRLMRLIKRQKSLSYVQTSRSRGKSLRANKAHLSEIPCINSLHRVESRLSLCILLCTRIRWDALSARKRYGQSPYSQGVLTAPVFKMLMNHDSKAQHQRALDIQHVFPICQNWKRYSTCSFRVDPGICIGNWA